jgi:DNA-binding CsgD family transcriptional regulator
LAKSDLQSNLESLTDAQKECLRLVLAHFSSKQIARQLGISRHTVDQRLRVAIQKLNATDRWEAARILASTESNGDFAASAAYQPIVYQSPQLPNLPDIPTVNGSGGEGDCRSDNRGESLNDGPSLSAIMVASEATKPQNVPVGEWVEGAKPLSVKVGMILGVCILSLIAFTAVVSALEILSRI